MNECIGRINLTVLFLQSFDLVEISQANLLDDLGGQLRLDECVQVLLGLSSTRQWSSLDDEIGLLEQSLDDVQCLLIIAVEEDLVLSTVLQQLASGEHLDSTDPSDVGIVGLVLTRSDL